MSIYVVWLKGEPDSFHDDDFEEALSYAKTSAREAEAEAIIRNHADADDREGQPVARISASGEEMEP